MDTILEFSCSGSCGLAVSNDDTLEGTESKVTKSASQFLLLPSFIVVAKATGSVNPKKRQYPMQFVRMSAKVDKMLPNPSNIEEPLVLYKY